MALSTFTSWAVPAVSTIAAWAGSSVVENLVSTGYSYLLDRMLPPDSEAELKRLQATLPQITAVMGIAEALKMKDPVAGQWVEQFRQAVEASEDVLDELEYKKLEDTVKNQEEEGGSASRSKKRKACTINDDILERLKEALTMLDRAAAGVEPLLQLATTLDIRDISQSWQEAVKVLNRETTSFLAEREVFGRDIEKDKIIAWLKQPTDACLSSFGIVRVGGQGKTTLVQLAYQEIRGSNHFDKTIWVCVSTNFSVEDITRKILGELDESSCSGKPLNALQETLKEKIHSKKVLLVLDDVWDEKRREWEQLIAPLRFVQQGSKILFTTRMKSVAEVLASVISTEHKSLALQGLGEQELCLLFHSYAFRGFDLDNHRDLQAIGDQILKMLRGSPLVAKVIGSLLNSCMDHQYWRRILNRGSLFNLEQAKDVVEVLKLSYYHLPANLQVCFRFCSIFPQDHKFDKDELIKMWIASGFIPQQSSQGERLEDIGEDYFNLLLTKSFFEYFNDKWVGERYVMHDLMHELAQNVSHGECCRIESNNISLTIPSTVRHVSVHDDSKIDRVSHLGNLRSLIIFPSFKSNSFVLPNNLIKKPLRLLKIEKYSTLELPEEISCLVHLRYLSVELNPIIRRTIFKYSILTSISTLYHLQVLKIPTVYDNSSYSGIETTGMTNLLRLRYVNLPSEIMKTIHGVHKLTSLQELTFFIGKEIGYRINELSTLNNLRHLSIENIENVGDPAEAKSANLLDKNNLMSLSLKWTSKSKPHNPEQIIDYLQPHPNLMELIIQNYKGQRSPNWMEESPVPLNLSSLKLLNCPLWKNQLFSWKMPYLKILDICNCLNMDKLPDMPLSLIEFRISNVGLTSLPALYQNSGNNTPAPLSLISSLRVVEIKSCPNLISLDGFLQQGNLDLPAIEELTILNCKRLVHLPTHGFGNLTSLIYLTLRNNPKLVAMDFQGYLLQTKLQQLTMGNCGELDLPLLEASSGVTTLAGLHLKNANIISFTSAQNSFRSLQSLNISDCTMLVEFSSLEEAHEINQENNVNGLNVSISYCPNLIKFFSLLPLSLTTFRIDNVGLSALPVYYQSSDSSSGPSTSSLIEVEIKKCQNLTSLNGFLQQDNIDFQSIRKITVINCKNLVHLPMGAFGKFVSLQDLTISDCPMLMAIDNQSTLLPISHIPELPTSLRELVIDDESSLKSLPTTMTSLTALERLTIDKANLLEELPELPTSLRELAIGDASSLKSLPATMARLIDLERLTISKANLLEELPELPTSLKELAIGDASSLKSLPTTMARLTALEELSIMKVDLLEELPELPTSLRELVIADASSLKSLPATMARLTALERLTISKANLLEELPELPTSLRNLFIDDASSLKSLPATMARLTALERLTIYKANLLEELPELPTSLRELNICNASSLKSLPATMVRLTVLERLEIRGANLLEELPELPTSLRELNIDDTSSLKSLPATMARLTALERLTISKANLLEELPELPTSLRNLFIDDASSLKSLPATMARLTALERLTIYKANLLEELPELPTSLRELNICNASSLKSLPATMMRLTVLERLEIRGANLLEELPELPTSLRELNIDDTSSLKSLPATMARLTALERLTISKANLLEELPELPTSLRNLFIDDASSLKSLLATMARLTTLEELSIMKVDLLEELPELPTSLRKLVIADASSLKSLPATMARLTALERLTISKANLLEELPELPTLRNLFIGDANSLKSLPAAMARLTALERLTIYKANLLEELPELPTSLRELAIGDASSLKSLPTTMARLIALERLTIYKANLLEELPELPASLKENYIEGRGGRLL